jgi:hypothetical protein
MTENTASARQATQKAFAALRQGDKHTARHWAEIAVALSPQREEPWLLLAAASPAHTSLKYLQRALAINPNSELAQYGTKWALAQLPEQPPTPPPPAQVFRPSAKFPQRYAFWALILVFFLLGMGWMVWPASRSLALVLMTGQTGFLRADVNRSSVNFTNLPALSPSPTPSVLPRFTATPTFFPVPTLTATPPPTETPTATLEPTITPTSLPSEKRILVDISEQHLYAYEGETLVFSFIASTGMGNSTRIGTFSVLDKIPNAYGATWNIWMPEWLGIYYSGYLENGIHALPILSNGQRLWAGYLGTPISFGCVVLGVEESQLLYDWADIGTVVEIQW